jgi:hypothetical protein
LTGWTYRALVWTFVTLVVVLALLAAKPYALAPADPALFAGGVPGPGLLADHRDGHLACMLRGAAVRLNTVG